MSESIPCFFAPVIFCEACSEELFGEDVCAGLLALPSQYCYILRFCVLTGDMSNIQHRSRLPGGRSLYGDRWLWISDDEYLLVQILVQFCFIKIHQGLVRWRIVDRHVEQRITPMFPINHCQIFLRTLARTHNWPRCKFSLLIGRRSRRVVRSSSGIVRGGRGQSGFLFFHVSSNFGSIYA